MIDLLVVGAGLTGATITAMANEDYVTTLVLEKRDHIAGNCYTYPSYALPDINVHAYGAHIFHTSNEQVWNFVQSYGRFSPYHHQVKAIRENSLYTLPFCMQTFYEIWDTKTPEEARNYLKQNRYLGQINTFEDQARYLVGDKIYALLIKDYTEKQWGKSCKDLPSSIIKRLPLRFNYNTSYFNDKYVGIPDQGYTEIIKSMLGQAPVLEHTDYLKDKEYWNSKAKVVVYTGCIDAYFEHALGRLEYRTLDFQHTVKNIEESQGVAVLNNCNKIDPWTRTIEHKFFQPQIENKRYTIISTETPRHCEENDIPYYPVPTVNNECLYRDYKDLAKKETNVIFAGRLGMYKYMDMHVAIENAMNLYKTQIRSRLF